jgi:hypothetical protein
MDPPPQSLACEAYTCFMVRILQIHRIQVWSAPGCATIAGSPRIVHRAMPRQTELAAVLGAVKDKPFGWR